jgi:hypothetical protein
MQKNLILPALIILPLSACFESKLNLSLIECKEIANQAVSADGPVKKYWDTIAQCMESKGFAYDRLNCAPIFLPTGEEILVGAEKDGCYLK